MSRSSVWLCGLAFLAGCGDLSSSPDKPVDRGILGKTTQDVGEFNADAAREISAGKVEKYDPVIGPLQAYGPILEQISALAIDQHLQLFHAEYDRYPKDHAEFMEKIVQANNLQLPVLPAGNEYQYDVANHKLVVVKPVAEPEESSDSGAAPY